MADNNWLPLRIGAGGYVTGIDIAADDTMVVRTDTYGAYIWNGTEWQQLVTALSMPAANVGIGNEEGVYEIKNRSERYKHLVHGVSGSGLSKR